MKRITEETRNIIVALHGQGLTYKDISASVGVSVATVSRIVGNRRNNNPEQLRAVIELFGTGVSCQAVAEQLGISASTVSRIVRGKTVASRKLIEARA